LPLILAPPRFTKNVLREPQMAVLTPHSKVLGLWF
jgi:hypothetical protein